MKNLVERTNDFTAAACQLYFLVVSADGNVDEKEVLIGKRMAEAEGIKSDVFLEAVENLHSQGKDQVLRNCISLLKKLPINDQIRLVAWISTIANADGFMDQKEWALIYRIYSQELNLDQLKIMQVQKQLNVLIS